MLKHKIIITNIDKVTAQLNTVRSALLSMSNSTNAFNALTDFYRSAVAAKSSVDMADTQLFLSLAHGALLTAQSALAACDNNTTRNDVINSVNNSAQILINLLTIAN